MLGRPLAALDARLAVNADGPGESDGHPGIEGGRESRCRRRNTGREFGGTRRRATWRGMGIFRGWNFKSWRHRYIWSHQLCAFIQPPTRCCGISPQRIEVIRVGLAESWQRGLQVVMRQ